MGEEPPEYDVPAGQTLYSAQAMSDTDGSILVMAQVQMFYSKRGTPGPWEPRTVMRNVQTLVYAKNGGAWIAHPFRNVQRYFSGSSFLAADADGKTRAFVQDRVFSGMFAREAGDWVAKGSRFPSPDGFQFSTGNWVGPMGESGWESYRETYSFPGGQYLRRQEIRRSDGVKFDLDSNQRFQPMAFLSGREMGYLLGTDVREFLNPSDNTSSGNDSLPDLVCYVWSHDPVSPRPRKHVVVRDRQGGYSFFARVGGETRLYAHATDSMLMEFALRGNEFVHLRDLAYPDLSSGNSGSAVDGPGKDSLPAKGTSTGAAGSTAFFSMHAVDSKGCSHALAAVTDASHLTRGFLHKSTCRDGVDSVTVPAPTARAEISRNSPINLVPGPDGTVMFVLVMTEPPIFDPEKGYYGDSYFPTWLYLARSKPSGGWEVESITEY